MYQDIDAVLIRAATRPADLQVPAWPDLSDGADPRLWPAWLHDVWSQPALAQAITTASPVLAEQAHQAIAGRRSDCRQLRRIVLATARYLLRSTGRSTPFGMFAGIAAATIGDNPAVRWGQRHHAVVRADSAWLAALITGLQQCLPLLRRTPVMVADTARVRDGRLVVPFQRPAGGHGPDETPVLDEVSVRLTPPITAAVGYANTPITAEDLAAKLAADFPATPMATIEKMILHLVRLRILLTGLHPSSTVTDTAGHLITVLREHPDIADAVRLLPTLTAMHPSIPQPRGARTTGDLHTPAGHEDASPPTSVDLRLDADVTLPPSLRAHARDAAAVLTRLTPYPAGLPAWQQYHGAFLQRYGPGAVVPLLELVTPETGLGLPATYRGSHRTVTDQPNQQRNRRLLRLAHRAVAAGDQEIVLDDRMIDDLAGDTPTAPAPPHVELFLRVHADSVDALRHGRYQLVVTGAARAAGATTGRFLTLLTAADQDRFRTAYRQVATARAGAMPVQVSGPPVLASTEQLGRTPRQLAAVVTVNELPDGDGDTIALDDLGVGADADGMFLVWLSRNRLVEPTVFNAIEFRNHSHPLTRFLCELTRARTAVYMPFSWGIADTLPALPRLRYGRTVLAPARWYLTAADLPGKDTPDEDWRAELTGWRHRYRVPDLVYLVEADNLLPLNLDQPLPLVLLRTHLDRHGHARLEQAPPPGAYGWLAGHAHDIVIPLTSTAAAAPAPQVAAVRPVRRVDAHLPGCGAYLSAKLYTPPARHTDLLGHIPGLITGCGEMLDWWYVPYADPDPHLRVRVRLRRTTDAASLALHHLSRWAQAQRDRGLLASLQVDTYQPETGRYGHDEAMTAAERFFAADSRVTLAHRQMAAQGAVDADALTAASLTDLATAFTGDPGAAMAWLTEHLPHRPVHAGRDVHAAAARLADPCDGWAALRAVCGDTVAAAWQTRRDTLTAYRHQLSRQRDPQAVLPSLLHMHHVRAFGIDPEREHLGLHLTRTVALRWTATRSHP